MLQNTNIGVDEIASADKISKSNANLDGSSQNGKLGASGAKDPLIQDHKSGEPSKGNFNFPSYHVSIPKKANVIFMIFYDLMLSFSFLVKG